MKKTIAVLLALFGMQLGLEAIIIKAQATKKTQIGKEDPFSYNCGCNKRRKRK